jgi:hypothetical protein
MHCDFLPASYSIAGVAHLFPNPLGAGHTHSETAPQGQGTFGFAFLNDNLPNIALDWKGGFLCYKQPTQWLEAPSLWIAGFRIFWFWERGQRQSSLAVLGHGLEMCNPDTDWQFNVNSGINLVMMRGQWALVEHQLLGQAYIHLTPGSGPTEWELETTCGQRPETSLFPACRVSLCVPSFYTTKAVQDMLNQNLIGLRINGCYCSVNSLGRNLLHYLSWPMVPLWSLQWERLFIEQLPLPLHSPTTTGLWSRTPLGVWN